MDSGYQFLMLGIPWAHSMPAHDVNDGTQLAEANWRHDKLSKLTTGDMISKNTIVTIQEHNKVLFYVENVPVPFDLGWV